MCIYCYVCMFVYTALFIFDSAMCVYVCVFLLHWCVLLGVYVCLCVRAAVFDEEAVLEEPGWALTAAVLRLERPADR